MKELRQENRSVLPEQQKRWTQKPTSELRQVSQPGHVAITRVQRHACSLLAQLRPRGLCNGLAGLGGGASHAAGFPSGPT